MEIEHGTVLAETVTRIQTRWGQGALHSLSDHAHVDVISTGFAALDEALHIGGVARGHLTELSGIPTSGMTTLAYQIVASVQRLHHSAIYIDLMRQFDAEYAAGCGVNPEQMLLLHPPDMDHALAVAQDVLLTQNVGLLVMDAGLDSRVHPDQLRRLMSPLHSSHCALVWLTLGMANPMLSECAALRVQMKRLAWCASDSEIPGYRTEITILKNKFAPGKRTLTLDITPGAV